MSNPRDRNLVRQARAATPKARLPALPPVPMTDPALAVFLNAVKERLEVREGSRGNPFEQVVTQRDLQDLGLSGSQVILTPTGAVGGVLVQLPGGNYATISVDAFAEGIRQSKLYQDLIRRLDDPVRFDGYPDEVKRILLNSIAEEAAARGADIQRMEHKIQTETRSLAMRVEEVTASVASAAAGVREVAFASADRDRAVAGQVTQVEARLDDVGGVTVEQAITAVADRATGLEGQYTLKIQAGNKVAGFGLAVTSPTAGAATSAFIINADKFAVVSGSDTITDPANPPTTRIPFGVDASGVYINGQVRINASGATLDSTAKRIQLSSPTTVYKVNAAGTADPTSITVTATLLNGLSGTVNWSVVSGTVSGYPKTGTSVAVPYADISTSQVTLRATVTQSSVTYTSEITLYKAFDGATGSTGATGATGATGPAGAAGANATAYWMTRSAGVIQRLSDGTYSPSGITLNAYSQSGSSAVAAYAGRFKIETTLDDVTYTTAYTSSANQSTYGFDIPPFIKRIRIGLYLAGGTTTLLDEELIPIVEDGDASPVPLLSSGNHILQSDSAGGVASYSAAETTMSVSIGGIDNSSNWSYYVSEVGTGVTYRDSDDTADRTAVGYIDGGLGGKNLLLHTNAFTNAAWTKTNTTVATSTAVVAPTGVPGQVHLISETTATGNHFVEQLVTVTQASPFAVSWLVKDKNRGSVSIEIRDGSTNTLVRVPFNLSSGVFGTQVTDVFGTFLETSAEQLDEGWWLVRLYGSLDGVGSQVRSRLYLQNGASISYAGATANGVYVIGAQLERLVNYATGERATGYTPNGATARTGTAGYFKLVNLSVDSSYAILTAARPGYPLISHRYGLTKAKTGERGSLTGYGTPYGLYLSGTSDTTDPWPSTSTNAYRANRVINNLLTGATLTTDLTTTTHLRLGDTVTLTNSAGTAVQTRYWSGVGWAKPGVIIDGNLLVTGTITGDKIAANEITVGKLKSGVDGSVGTDLTFGLNIQETNTTWYSAVWGLSTSNTKAGVMGVSAATGTPAGPPGVTGIATSTQAYGGGFYSYNGTTQTSKAVLGGNGEAGVFSKGTNNLFVCNGTYSLYNLSGEGKYYIQAGIGPFTAYHEAITLDTPALGDIMCDDQILERESISTVIASVKLSATANERGAIGICSELWADPPTGWGTNDGGGAVDPRPLPAGYTVVHMNAVGEGLINVCGESGDIAKGDLIVTSSTPGKGMKQADDIVRSHTIAKSREAVTFATPGEVKMIACIYLCG